MPIFTLLLFYRLSTGEAADYLPQDLHSAHRLLTEEYARRKSFFIQVMAYSLLESGEGYEAFIKEYYENTG